MKVLKQISKLNGYKDEMELLRDYGVVPSVLMKRHKPIDLIPLLWKHLRKKNTKRESQ